MQTTTRWAVNPGFDRVFLLASMAAPFLFFMVYRWASPWVESQISLAPELVFFALFTGLFDAPHIFQTLLRTHRGVEFQRRPWFHNLSLMAALGITLGLYGLGQHEAFIAFLGFFGGWHILRQNLGFLRVYQSKESRASIRLHKNERQFLYFTWIYFLFREMNSRQEWFSSMYLTSSFYKWTALLLTLFWGVVFIMLLAKNRVEENWSVRWPKVLFLYGQCFSFFIFAQLETPFLIMIALATITHTIQYHGWIHLWGRSQRAWCWKPQTLYYATWLLGLILMTETLGQTSWTSGWVSLAVLYNGFVLWHYFIDGFIWRFRSQPELSELVSQKICFRLKHPKK